ncbi:MAG TPA: methyltransferase domain-containing protein [Candidatus Saccharimonadales bacterium]|nr:methyltransferase domain-containing protein [Candidatus Saccharimonadales bacterium]
MLYNDIYKQSYNAFGNSPSSIVKKAAQLYLRTNHVGIFLDIGAGQGRDSFYMAGLGFKVEAIDSSDEACRQIEKTVSAKQLDNIKVDSVDIKNFKIEKDKFNIISAVNVLHMLEKNTALGVIKMIKEMLPNDGLAVISILILKNGFREQELLKIFEDFEVLYSFESAIKDKHPSQPEEHTHFVSRIIARKNI